MGKVGSYFSQDVCLSLCAKQVGCAMVHLETDEKSLGRTGKWVRTFTMPLAEQHFAEQQDFHWMLRLENSTRSLENMVKYYRPSK